MFNIELRKDGWFEAGKDDKETFPYAHSVYLSKQELKKKLEEIGEKSSIEELDKALSELPEPSTELKGTPYIIGKDVMIGTHGLPGECYLGSIKK